MVKARERLETVVAIFSEENIIVLELRAHAAETMGAPFRETEQADILMKEKAEGKLRWISKLVLKVVRGLS